MRYRFNVFNTDYHTVMNMNYRTSILLFLSVVLLFAGCGPSEEEQQRREQARQDSLEQLRRQQQQQDSLEQARSDSLQKTRRQPRVSFSETGRFTIQVESWRSQVKARQRAEMWQERGYPHAYVVRHGPPSTGNIWYRVRLGQVDSREQARKLQQMLQEKYQVNTWIGTAN